MLGRWGSDGQPPPVQDGGRGVGHPGSISHRPLVGGADRPKGRESRHTGMNEVEAVDKVSMPQQPTFCVAMCRNITIATHFANHCLYKFLCFGPIESFLTTLID